MPRLQLVQPFQPRTSPQPSLIASIHPVKDPDRLGACMDVQPAPVEGDQPIQSEPLEEPENGASSVKSVGADELRHTDRAGLMHRIDHAARDLDPVDHLEPVERTHVLTEFDRLVKGRDQRKEVVGKALIRVALALSV